MAFDGDIEVVEAMEVVFACYHNSLEVVVAVAVEVEVEQHSYWEEADMVAVGYTWDEGEAYAAWEIEA